MDVHEDDDDDDEDSEKYSVDGYERCMLLSFAMMTMFSYRRTVFRELDKICQVRFGAFESMGHALTLIIRIAIRANPIYAWFQ